MSTRPTPVSNGGTSAERMLDEIRQVFHTLASHLPLEITPKRATHFFQGITEITCALVNTQKLLDELVNSINDGGEPWPELERARSVLALLEVHTNG